MPFHDTRLGPGTLTFGSAPLEVGFQVNACTLTPAPDETDGTPTLAVPEPPPEYKNKYTLDGTAINDFTNPAGFQRYAMDNDGSEVEFVWTPNSDEFSTPAALTGTVQMRAFPMGGTVGELITTDFSFPVIGLPVWAGGTASARSGEKSAK